MSAPQPPPTTTGTGTGASKLWSPSSPRPEGAAGPNPRRESVSAGEQLARQRNPGRRVAQIVELKPEFVDKYKEVHAAVWPEVRKQIKACNIQDCE